MKRIMSGIAIGALMLGSIVTFGVTAASSATPSIVVTPSTGLTDGQAVTITGTGFGANEGSLLALECALGSTDLTTCNTSVLVPMPTTSASGGFTATFHVFAGTTGSGSCDLGTTDTTCLLVVGNQNNQAEKATATISFGSSTSTTTTTTPGGTTTTTTTTTTVPATTTTTAPIVLGPRHIKVAPSTNLKKGQSVLVTGSGFTPGDHVFILECLASVHSSAQCNLSTLKSATISAKGVLPATHIKVLTGKIGTGTCGTKASNKKSCVISVGNASKGDAAIAHIAFK